MPVLFDVQAITHVLLCLYPVRVLQLLPPVCQCKNIFRLTLSGYSWHTVNMKEWVVVILLFVLFQGWDTTDKVMYGACIAAYAGDLYSTSVFLRDDKYHESSKWIFTEHPSIARLVAVGIGYTAVQYIIADNLPGGWRKAVLGVCTGISVNNIRHNTVACNIEWRL